MCAIIGSFDKKIVADLAERNQHRGRIAYSISLHNLESGNVVTEYRVGEFDPVFLENLKTDGCYIICHLQSPTGTSNAGENITQPSIVNSNQGSSCLWHNGILMPSAMKMIQHKLHTVSKFDTRLLHQWLLHDEKLDEIEGSFACVFAVNSSVKIFRSKHSKLYIDENMTISSESFANSKCINSDRIYAVDLHKRSLAIESYFKTKRYNIIIKGELDD